MIWSTRKVRKALRHITKMQYNLDYRLKDTRKRQELLGDFLVGLERRVQDLEKASSFYLEPPESEGGETLNH